MFVLSVVGASAASALENPEFTTAKFPVSFKSVNKEETKLETVGGNKVFCTGNTVKGEITGARAIKAFVATFTGCKAEGIFGKELKCSSGGTAGAEEIVTNNLKGKPVYTNKAAKEVGLDLEPEAGAEAELAKFTCKGLVEEKITVGGVKGTPASVIGQVPTKNGKGEEQLNKKRTTLEVIFAQEKGKQKPEEYEEGGKKIKDVLNSTGAGAKAFGPEQSGQLAKGISEATAEIELKA
jgi:hypothetical protein